MDGAVDGDCEHDKGLLRCSWVLDGNGPVVAGGLSQLRPLRWTPLKQGLQIRGATSAQGRAFAEKVAALGVGRARELSAEDRDRGQLAPWIASTER